MKGVTTLLLLPRYIVDMLYFLIEAQHIEVAGAKELLLS